MPDIDDLSCLLQQSLPGAALQFQRVPGCKGLELLLIEPGFDVTRLTQQQIEHLSDAPPYWIFCWASGRALASAILTGNIDVEGKVVMDFGAGSGVVGIAAKMAGAKKVYACDIDDTCCRLAQLNAEHNGVEVSVVRAVEAVEEPLDLVLAADVLYEKENLRFLDLMLGVCNDVLLADSRLKSMPDCRFNHFETIFTTSFPDYGEAKANNEVKLYRS